MMKSRLAVENSVLNDHQWKSTQSLFYPQQ